MRIGGLHGDDQIIHFRLIFTRAINCTLVTYIHTISYGYNHSILDKIQLSTWCPSLHKTSCMQHRHL